MSQVDNPQKTPKKQVIYYVFGILMIAIYLCMAYLLIFSQIFADNISTSIRYTLGIVFFLYGGLRAFRQIKGL